MSTIVTRAGVGRALTIAEGDANFTNLNNDKLESTSSSSVNSEVALFSGTGGKTLMRATSTGIMKMISGVLAMCTAADIVSLLGTTAVSNATNAVNATNAGNADTVDGYHAASFVRTVNSTAPDGSGNVAVNVDMSTRALVGGSNASGTWPINITGNAATVGGYAYNGLPYMSIGGFNTLYSLHLFRASGDHKDSQATHDQLFYAVYYNGSYYLTNNGAWASSTSSWMSYTSATKALSGTWRSLGMIDQYDSVSNQSGINFMIAVRIA